MNDEQILALVPRSEVDQPEEERLTYGDILEMLGLGKALWTPSQETRLYKAFGLTKPRNVFYPTLTWNTSREAALQEIFTEQPTGSAVECHYVAQQICDMLGLGNPAGMLHGRGFRGRAYSQALKQWLLPRVCIHCGRHDLPIQEPVMTCVCCNLLDELKERGLSGEQFWMIYLEKADTDEPRRFLCIQQAVGQGHALQLASELHEIPSHDLVATSLAQEGAKK